MNPNYPHPLIAREGWPYLAGIALVSLSVEWGLGFLWAIPFWVLTLFVLQFFRDPPRGVPVGERLIL
ncbi:phosphatidylserine decarboxylase, partial [mine drainage metagenome]